MDSTKQDLCHNDRVRFNPEQGTEAIAMDIVGTIRGAKTGKANTMEYWVHWDNDTMAWYAEKYLIRAT